MSRLGNKIYSLLKLDKYNEAEVLLTQVLQLAEKLFTQDHPKYAYLLAKVAELQFNQGEYLKAEEARLQANHLFEKFYGTVSFTHAFGLNVLAEIYATQSKFTKTQSIYQEAIQIRNQLDNTNMIRIAAVQSNLTRLMVKTGEYQQAYDLIEQVIKIYTQNKKDNLYNHITKAAAFIGNGEDTIQCQLGMKQIIDLIPRLSEKSEFNWERMLNKIWIGELALKCNNNAMAKEYLNIGLEKSKTVYKQDSIGQKLTEQRVDALLNL